MPVPLLDLTRQYAALQEEIESAVCGLMRRQQFILGPEVEGFEQELAAACGAEHAVGVSSGTDGQLALLMALGFGPGDAVVTTPFTFFATAGGLYRLGIEPVFCDIRPDTFNLDVAALAHLLSELPTHSDGGKASHRGHRIRAVLPVHLFGQCAEMKEMKRVADAADCLLIEDAAQAIGAWDEGGQAGTLGIASWLSFFPSKNLGGFGDGGAVLCRDSALAERLKNFRNHGMDAPYSHAHVGGNFRLDALQAVVLRKKLPHLGEWNRLRREHAAFYRSAWEAAGLEDRLVAPVERTGTPGRPRHIYHQYVVRVPDRDGLKRHLDLAGIGNAIYYPCPLHLQPCFAGLGYRAGDFPVAEQATREVLALPIFPELRESEREEVASEVTAFLLGSDSRHPGPE